ncbi:MAG: hypothetical protein U0793_14960 [Gemmataceae bacterium]
MERAELRLSEMPLTLGESRDEGERIAFFPPLAVEYCVVPDAELVVIFHVGAYGKQE